MYTMYTLLFWTNIHQQETASFGVPSDYECSMQLQSIRNTAHIHSILKMDEVLFCHHANKGEVFPVLN
jgi:hypothetical protein